MKYSIIDIGTNSTKHYLAELKNNEIKTLINETIVTRLGQNLNKTHIISAEAMDRTAKVISKYVFDAKNIDADKIIAVGTMCLREANNSTDFVKKVFAETGVNIEIISGEEEARLSHLAAISTINIGDENIIVFDIGGGSTEFIFGNSKNINRKFSINIGASVISEKYNLIDKINKNDIEKVISDIKNKLNEYNIEKKEIRLIGIGGTVTTLKAVELKLESYDAEKIHNTVFDRNKLDELLDIFIEKGLKFRKEIKGLEANRANIIIGGTCIVKAILEFFDEKEFIVSDCGLRNGVFIDRFKNK